MVENPEYESIIQQKAQEWSKKPETSQEAQPTEPEVPKEAPSESVQQTNFRTLKQEKERIERERNEALWKIKEYEALQKNQVTPKEEDFNISPDELVEGKHFKKMYDQNKRLEAEVEALKSRVTEDVAEARIRSRFPDFYTVVTTDNVEALRQTDPEILDSINDGRDLYKKAVAIYKAIQTMGTKSLLTEQDKKKVQENAAKPRPMASVSPQQGESPLSHANAFANGLTPELKKQLLKEMNEARRNM
jgi:hypothetical protein